MIKNMKKKAAMAAAAGMIALSTLGTAVPAFAAPADFTDLVTEKQAAVNSAAAVVPSAAVLTSAKTGENAFEMEFLDPNTLQRFHVTVDRATDKVAKVVIDSSNYPGSVTVSKTEADAKATILQTYPDATDIVVTSVKDSSSGTPFVVYKATFKTKEFTGTALLNPATCLIGHQELVY